MTARPTSLQAPSSLSAASIASLLALGAGAAGAVVGPWAEAPEAKVRLVSRYAAATPGGDAGLGLEFQLAPGWHVYWKNPGDAGYAPTLSFEGAALSETRLLYPRPSRFELPGGLVAYGYESAVVYPIEAALAPGAGAGANVPLKANLAYLVCAESCIPYEAELALALPLSSAAERDPATEPLVEAAWAKLPAPAPQGIDARLVDGSGAGASKTLEMTFAVSGARAATPDLFFESHPLLSLERPVVTVERDQVRFSVPIRALDVSRPLPDRLRFAWTATGFERAGAPAAWEGELDLGSESRVAPQAARAPAPIRKSSRALAATLVAFLAGTTYVLLTQRSFRRRTPSQRP